MPILRAGDIARRRKRREPSASSASEGQVDDEGAERENMSRDEEGSDDDVPLPAKARKTAKRARAAQQSDDGDEEAAYSEPPSPESNDEAEDTDDEWRPDEPKKDERKGKGKGKAAALGAPGRKKQKRTHSGGSSAASSEDVDEDEDDDFEEDDDHATRKRTDNRNKSKGPRASKPKVVKKGQGKQRHTLGLPKPPAKLKPVEQGEALDEEMEAALAEAEAIAEEEERRREAKKAWEDVRARKAARERGEVVEPWPSPANQTGSSAATLKEAATPSSSAQQGMAARPTSNPAPKPSVSLTSWLGVPEPSWPVTCPSALITDRDSLFVGYVYSLEDPSEKHITSLLTHLNRTVHPTMDVNALPEPMRGLAPGRRGATHDMYAWRVLALKPGRDGTSGPGDYGIEEGSEDDGERGGGRAVMKALRESGATDVLVVVSRWYGGTMLGPVRFQHIENAAREALAAFVREEEVGPIREELKALDARIDALRREIDERTGKVGAAAATAAGTAGQMAAAYKDMDVDRAQRLRVARGKTIEALERRLAGLKAGGGAGIAGAAGRALIGANGRQGPSPARSIAATSGTSGASSSPPVPASAPLARPGIPLSAPSNPQAAAATVGPAYNSGAPATASSSPPAPSNGQSEAKSSLPSTTAAPTANAGASDAAALAAKRAAVRAALGRR